MTTHLVPLSRGTDFIFIDGRTFNSDYWEGMRSEIDVFHLTTSQDTKLVEASRFLSWLHQISTSAIYQLQYDDSQLPALVRLRADRTVSSLGKHIRHPLLRRAFSIQPLLVEAIHSQPPLYFLIHYWKMGRLLLYGRDRSHC